MFKQAFGEESMGCTRVFQWECPNLPRPKKGETCKEESEEHAHNFDIKGTVHKEFVLSGPVVVSSYCCDVLW
jgi:hypothetical protein